MPTIVLTAHGKVTGLWGSAIIKGADGHAHPLKPGDIVRRGDVILTSQDGIVELTSDGNALPIVAAPTAEAATGILPADTPPKAEARNEVDRVIEKLAQDDADAATAAGLAGGDGGEFLPGLRVDRITESLTTLGLDSNQAADANDTPPVADAEASAAALANIAPSALDDAISGPENTTLPVDLRGVDSDGNVVSITVTSVSTGGTLLLADGITVVSAGQTLTPAQAVGLLFRPTADFVGQAAITFFVTDNQGSTSNGATVSLNVVDTSPPPPTNQAPVGVNDSATTAEDTPATGNVLGNDRDPDGDALTVTQFSIGGATYAAGDTAVLAGIGRLTLAGNGAYTFTPEANYNGPVPVATYTVSDGVDSVTATLTLSVTAVADAPLVTPDTVPATEDQAVVFDPRSNDGNIDGTPLAITAIGGQPIAIGTPVVLPQGTVSLNADGTLTFTPNPNVNGPVVFDYTVSNGGAASTSQVTINIAPVNDAPVAVDDLTSTPINTSTTITVLGNDSDVDGNALTVTAASVDPARGAVSINPNGTLAFTPAGNVSGPVLVSYTISDGQGGFASATVTVNVGPNTPPTGTNALVVIAEDGSRTFTATDFGFSDADAGQSFANVRIDVLPAAGTLTLLGVLVVAGQVIAVADLANLVYEPAPNANGSGYASFSFSVQDSGGAFDTLPNQITIDVTPVADAAVIGGVASGATVEDTTLSTGGTLTITDPDASEAAFNPLTGVAGAHGTFNIDASGVWTYTLDNTDPAVQALGAGQSLPNETFTVTSIDGTSQVVTVTITGTNEAPVAQAASAAVDEDAPLFSGTVTATDLDANAVLSFSLNAAPPPGLTFNPNGSYTFDASNAAYQSLAAGQQQVLTIPYTVTDDQGATSSANLVITVTGTNDAPIAANDSASTPINTSLASIDVLGNDSDLDGGTLTVTAANLVNPALGSISINPNGTLAFTPASNVSGPVVVNYTVGDGQGGFSNATVTITVGTNTPPAGSDTATSLAEDTSRAFSAADFGYSDADAGQSFAQVRIDTLPTAGALTLNGIAVAAGQIVAVADLGNLLFTPAPNANGSAYAGFDFSVQDSAGAFDSMPNRLTIAVSAVNDAPVASGVATLAAINEDDTNPAGATVGSLFSGHFSDAADHISGGSSANTFAGIAISNHTPDASKGTWQYSTDGGTNWATLPAGSNAAAVTLASSDLLRFLPATNYNGSATPLDAHLIESGGESISSGATVDLSAGTGASSVYSVSTVVVNQTINPVNDPPVAVNDQFTTAEDVPLTITRASLLANDSDVDGNPLSVIYAVSAVGGTLDIVAGNFVFTPNPNYFGPASFTYGISDGRGGTATGTVNIDVTPVNDAPVARPDEGAVTAAQTLIVSAAQGVIQSTAAPAGRDTDVDGDALTVTRVSAGAGAPTTLVPTGGATIAGTYGDLLLRNDGSYSYTASRADAVATGTRVNDVFTYQVSDGNGGFATASLTLQVGGAADTLNAAPPTTTVLTSTLGLNGEYYGYNDFNPGPTSPNRRHSDDGVHGNLDRAADVTSIVNGRNAAFTAAGTPGIVGTSTAAAEDAADARFTARAIDYGTSPTVTGTLGTNLNIAAGGSTAGLTNDNSQLFKFLNRSGGGDASTITVGRGTGDNDQIGGGPTSGLGRTSDAAIRLSGQAYLAAGLYDIRVYADDGFRLRLDDQTVAAFDNIQSPTTRVYTGVPIDGGLTPLELLYWEQGGNAVLRVEFKLSGTADSAYQVLGSQNLPLFSDANAPVLSDLQDLVAGPTPGSYLVRTGSLLDGGNGDDTLTGSAGRDILIGGQGKDTLNGGAGDDLIRGGAGHDQLTGGAGHDVFRWSLGDAGTAGAPARDVITDFDNTPHAGDVLDLRDLLVGESHAANTVALPASIGLNNALTITANDGNLVNYLHFSMVGGNTVVEISSTGGFTSSYTPAAVDQVITLTGLNLVGSFSNDQQVINDLLQRGKLVTD